MYLVSRRKIRFTKHFQDEIAGFRCTSCADCSIIVRPRFSIDPIEPGASVFGILTRDALASEIEQLLNAALGKKMEDSD